MSKKLAIIGNSVVNRDHSGFVDSCDLVIRFNACQNYAANTGRKADVICLTNWGPPAKQFSIDKTLLGLGFISLVKEIWFARPRKGLIENRFYYLANRRLIDYGQEIIGSNKLFDKRIVYFSKELHNQTWAKLLKTGETRAIMPSTGMLSIERVLSDPILAGFEKHILGFTFNGWKGHPWDLEEKLVNNYVEKGMLCLLK